MKIKKPTNKSKTPFLAIIAVIVALLLISSYGVVAYKKSWWPFPPEQAQNVDSQQDTVNESPKNSNSVKKGEDEADTNNGKTSDQVPVSKAFAATITQLEQEGNDVKFSAKIENSPTAGTCVLTFTNANDRPVTKEFDATIKDGVAVCKSEDIPALEFSYLGEWMVSFRYYAGSEQATANGKVTIQ